MSFESINTDDSSKTLLVQNENDFLREFYHFEIEFKTQRLMQFMKRHDKSEHKLIASIINKLEREKILRVSGLDMFIELNKLKIVKSRIGIK